MADGNRRQVAPLRKLIAIVLGTLATFIMLFGAGMTSWTIVALGVALLVVAIGLVAVTAVRTGARAWVAGVGHVHSVSEPPASSNFGRCELQIVIDAPGVPPRSVKIRDPRVPVAKWPDPGATLPIMVAIDDQRHVRVLWDEVLTHAEAAAADLPPDFDRFDGPDDAPLIDEEAPPWARRERDDDFPPPDEPVPVGPDDDLGGELGDDDLGGRRKEPVVVRQTPGGRIVLEGTLVEAPPSSRLPRRPRPSPDPADLTGPAYPGDESAGPRTAVITEEAPPDRPRATPDNPDPTGGDAQIDIDLDPVGPLDPVRPDAPRGGTGRDGTPTRAGVPADAPFPDDAPFSNDPSFSNDAPESAEVAASADGGGTPDEDVLAGLTTAGAGAGGAGPIHGVGITLLVADLDRSVTFYRDMLGFHEIDGGDGNAVLASGPTRIVLRAIRDVAPINRRLVHLNLEVGDLQATYEELRSKGIRFTYAPRAVNRGAKLELWAAAFRDPDGHGIALTQWRGR